MQTLRKRIQIEMDDVVSSDPNERGLRYASVAFTLAVSAESATDAQKLTRQLSEAYLEAHRDEREARAKDITDFLEEEADRLQVEIADLDGRLAGFKQDEQKQLPELMGINRGLFERTQQKIDQAEQRIRAYQQQITAIAGELALTDPYQEVISEGGRVLQSGSERLSGLTLEYLRVSSRYSAEHPDVKRLVTGDPHTIRSKWQ